MLLYPWLASIYQQLLKNYRSDQGHHTLLLNSLSTSSSESLINFLVQSLFCVHPNINGEACQQCAECLLFKAHTHPDFYHLLPHEHYKKIGVDQVRELMSRVLTAPQRSQYRFILIPEVNLLTESAANALLKLIEEPPPRSYFILASSRIHAIPATIRSRCLIVNLPMIPYKESIDWLTQQLDVVVMPKEIIAAILLENRSPERALALLNSSQWLFRKEFFSLLYQVLQSRTFLELFSEGKDYSDGTGELLCYWLATVFIDLSKYQQGLSSLLINRDQNQLIVQFATLAISLQQLNDIAAQCLIVRQKIIDIPGVNQELLLVELFIEIDNLLFNQGR